MNFKLLAPLALAAVIGVPQMSAAVTEQLFLDAGGGTTATITVNTGGVIGCVGTCGGLTAILSGGDHGQLGVLGNIGQFSISSTGRGFGVLVAPTLQTLNQVNASTTGAGTLVARYTVLDYTTLGGTYVLGVSGVDDVGINTSRTSFQALVSAANAVPAATLIGQFLNQVPNTGTPATSFSNAGNFASPIAGSTGSLTSMITLAFTGAGTMQANLTISNLAVPEPASIVFLGTALLGLSTLIRKRAVAKS